MMLRVIHAFSVKPGIDELAFIEWLDGRLDEITRRFGCIERKTWVFLDGFEGTYERSREVRRPRYLNEAFWVGEQAANEFRRWLLSPDGAEFRQRWFDSITDHMVLRYLDYERTPAVTDD